MSEFLNKAEEILQNAEFFLVPVTVLNRELKKNFPEKVLSDEQLTEILRHDERFRIFSSSLEKEKINYTPASFFLLEENGITIGPRVMLKSRTPTKKEVIDFLLDKANQTFETLKKAWEMRPPNDEYTEDQLLEALAKAQRLQRQLSKLTQGDLKEVEKERFRNL